MQTTKSETVMFEIVDDLAIVQDIENDQGVANTRAAQLADQAGRPMTVRKVTTSITITALNTVQPAIEGKTDVS